MVNLTLYHQSQGVTKLNRITARLLVSPRTQIATSMNLGKFTPKSNWSNARLVVKSRTQLNRSFAGSISQSNHSISGSKSQSHHVFVQKSLTLVVVNCVNFYQLVWIVYCGFARRVSRITRRLPLLTRLAPNPPTRYSYHGSLLLINARILRVMLAHKTSLHETKLTRLKHGDVLTILVDFVEKGRVGQPQYYSWCNQFNQSSITRNATIVAYQSVEIYCLSMFECYLEVIAGGVMLGCMTLLHKIKLIWKHGVCHISKSCGNVPCELRVESNRNLIYPNQNRVIRCPTKHTISALCDRTTRTRCLRLVCIQLISIQNSVQHLIARIKGIEILSVSYRHA